MNLRTRRGKNRFRNNAWRLFSIPPTLLVVSVESIRSLTDLAPPRLDSLMSRVSASMSIPPDSTCTLGLLLPDSRPSPQPIYLLMWKREDCSAPSSVSTPSCRLWPRSNEPRPDHAPPDSEFRAVRSPVGSFPGSFFDLLVGHFTSFFAGIMP